MEQKYKKWLMQYRKGYLEICILKALEIQGKMHGAKLISYFERFDLLIKEGTIYPLLNRMQQNGWIDSSWDLPKQSGHPRKSYQINSKGKKTLPIILESYQKHHKSLMELK